jgi:Family of unknown function (DUF6252)
MNPTVRRSASSASYVLLLALASACGKSSTGPGNDSSKFTATLDGTPWSANSTTASATGATGGVFAIAGADAAGTAVSLVVYNLGAPGTYPLGVGGTIFGGSGTVSQSSSSWWTALSGNAGSVTITAVSATHITGTFSFVAVPLVGGGSNRTVANGSFDLPVTSSGSVAVPANSGNTIAATLGGSPWNAATAVMVSGPSSGTVFVGWTNDSYSVNLVISGFTGAATYQMNTDVSRYFSITQTGTSKTWGWSGAKNTGSVVVTSVTTSRIMGTFNVTLQPGGGSPGTGDLTFVGSFNIAIP